MPIAKDCTKIDRRTAGWANISFTAFVIKEKRIGRRSAGSRVSGMRNPIHITEMVEKMIKARKIPRQPTPAMITAPIAGAKAGTSVKISITIDTMRAISRPEYRSRTIATATMRGPEAPSP
eukprot:GHVU01075380.1.p2 GENE.GHVU01075380.1~~GHVU01075380.1.p2  ORF type:complete len:121 (-),score=10.71 GHVU01075380.1:14-376(-)